LQTRHPVSRTENKNTWLLMFVDEVVEIAIDKVYAGTCSPVTEKFWFDIFRFEWTFEEIIVLKIDLRDSEIVSGSDVFFYRSNFFLHDNTSIIKVQSNRVNEWDISIWTKLENIGELFITIIPIDLFDFYSLHVLSV